MWFYTDMDSFASEHLKKEKIYVLYAVGAYESYVPFLICSKDCHLAF